MLKRHQSVRSWSAYFRLGAPTLAGHGKTFSVVQRIDSDEWTAGAVFT